MVCMSRAIFSMDMPKNCLECPLLYKADKLSLGDFKYQILYRCRMEPGGIEDVYLEDIMHKRQNWCPLKLMPEKRKANALSLSPLLGETFSEYNKGWNDCIDAICEKY